MLQPASAASEVGLLAWVNAARVQAVALLAALLLVGSWHWGNDGLWFQGDAPRHAATGLFLWDLLTTLPADPLLYALSYYARYPVLVLGAYPPLFHLAEAVGFGLLGPSPYVARGIVLACAGLTGAYAMAWGRRAIAPLAGWAGACTVLLPGYMRYSNAVLLNVPAAAFGLAGLYHFHAWLDDGRRRDRALFIVWTVAAIFTYLPGAIVLPIAMAWLLFSKGRRQGRFLVVLTGLLGVVVLALGLAMPAHLARQVPSLTRLTSSLNWVFYGRQLVAMVGLAWILLAAAGALAGVWSRAFRASASRLVLGCAAALTSLALLPARDERYALIIGPLIVLTAFVGLAMAAAAAGRRAGALTAAALVVLLGLTVEAALRIRVMHVSGIDEVARYLRDHGPDDAVLYSGIYDGVFGFYVRAMDPGYARRVVFSGRLLYEYRQAVDFTWTETPHATSPEEVVRLMRTRSGCRWVAVEVGGEGLLSASEHLLRTTLDGPAFVLVRSFPVTGRPVTRIDLYRFILPLDPAPPIDLAFPSFSSRVFHGVEPIAALH